jgi:hypothetical protein
MTLIVGQTSARFALHIGDRLVSVQSPGKPPSPFDVLANKSLLYVAPDGIVAIGYTGLAYLEGVPTDQRLAEILIGKRYPRTETPRGMSMGQKYAGRSIGLAIRALLNELTAIWSGHWMTGRNRRFPFDVLGVGWQWNRRGRARPIAFILPRPGGANTEFEYQHLPRHLGRICWTLCVPRSNKGLLDGERLRRESLDCMSADLTEQAIVNEFQSLNEPSVGKNCVSILIPPPANKSVRIRYFPYDEFRMTVPLRRNRVVRVAFTPWMIGSSFVAAPMAFTGTAHVPVGNFDVKLEAPYQLDSGVEFAMAPFPRQLQPR